MSYYLKNTFISAEPLFATVKEELRSYFDASVVDDSLFPLWLNKCLENLGKSSYDILPSLLNICEFEASLPDGFLSAREVWMCSNVTTDYRLPSATYTQVSNESIRLDTPDLRCDVCAECDFPDIIKAVYKTTNVVALEVRREYLLTPGNIYPSCPEDLYCMNKNAVSAESYDIRDNKLVTTFREGIVYLQYYSSSYDKDEVQMIPDVFEVKEYIELFLKQKLFEQIYNQTTDETFNQSRQKYLEYKQQSDEAFIIAVSQNKKQDVYKKQRAIKRIHDRFKGYDIR